MLNSPNPNGVLKEETGQQPTPKKRKKSRDSRRVRPLQTGQMNMDMLISIHALSTTQKTDHLFLLVRFFISYVAASVLSCGWIKSPDSPLPKLNTPKTTANDKTINNLFILDQLPRKIG